MDIKTKCGKDIRLPSLAGFGQNAEYADLTQVLFYTKIMLASLRAGIQRNRTEAVVASAGQSAALEKAIKGLEEAVVALNAGAKLVAPETEAEPVDTEAKFDEAYRGRGYRSC